MPRIFCLIFDCIVVCAFFIGSGFVVGGGDWDFGWEGNVKSYEGGCSIKWHVWAPVDQVY